MGGRNERGDARPGFILHNSFPLRNSFLLWWQTRKSLPQFWVAASPCRISVEAPQFPARLPLLMLGCRAGDGEFFDINVYGRRDSPPVCVRHLTDTARGVVAVRSIVFEVGDVASAIAFKHRDEI